MLLSYSLAQGTSKPANLNPKSRPPAPAKKLATFNADLFDMAKIYKMTLTNPGSNSRWSEKFINLSSPEWDPGIPSPGNYLPSQLEDFANLDSASRKIMSSSSSG